MKRIQIVSSVFTDDDMTMVKEVMQENPSLSEEDATYMISELKAEDLEMLTDNITKNLKVSNDLIIIADLQFWNGRKSGYKLVSKEHLEDIFASNLLGYDDFLYFVEDNDLKINLYHHDGTHRCQVREFRKNLSDSKKGELLKKIYFNKVTKEDITRYTKSIGRQILKIFGETHELNLI